MELVVGDLPMAAALAAALPGPVAVISREPVDGPLLWRRGDLATGEGLAEAVRAASRLWLLCDRRADGALGAATKVGGRPTIAVVPRGATAPVADRVVRVAEVWGPEHPLHRAWRARIMTGRHLFVADLGPVTVTPVAAAVAAVVGDAAEAPTMTTTLDALIADIARAARRPARATRLGWRLAAWQAGVDPALRARLTAP